MPLFDCFTFDPEILFNSFPLARISDCKAAHTPQPVAGGCYKNGTIRIGPVDYKGSKQCFGAERHNCSSQEAGRE